MRRTAHYCAVADDLLTQILCEVDGAALAEESQVIQCGLAARSRFHDHNTVARRRPRRTATPGRGGVVAERRGAGLLDGVPGTPSTPAAWHAPSVGWAVAVAGRQGRAGHSGCGSRGTEPGPVWPSVVLRERTEEADFSTASLRLMVLFAFAPSLLAASAGRRVSPQGDGGGAGGGVSHWAGGQTAAQHTQRARPARRPTPPRSLPLSPRDDRGGLAGGPPLE